SWFLMTRAVQPSSHQSRGSCTFASPSVSSSCIPASRKGWSFTVSLLRMIYLNIVQQAVCLHVLLKYTNHGGKHRRHAIRYSHSTTRSNMPDVPLPSVIAVSKAQAHAFTKPLHDSI